MPIVALALLAANQTHRTLDPEAVQKLTQNIAVEQTAEGAGDSLSSPRFGALTHAAFQGPIGPFADAVFLAKSVDNRQVFWVIDPASGRAWSPTIAGESTAAVWFSDIYGDGQPEVLVLFSDTVTGGGEGARDSYQAVGFEWSQGRFVARWDLFEDCPVLDNAKTAKACMRVPDSVPMASHAPADFSMFDDVGQRAASSQVGSAMGGSSSKPPLCRFDYYPSMGNATGRSATEFLDSLQPPDAKELFAAYSAVATDHGFVEVESGREDGQPYVRYARGDDKLQFKMSHGRGNLTMKIGFHYEHCSG